MSTPLFRSRLVVPTTILLVLILLMSRASAQGPQCPVDKNLNSPCSVSNGFWANHAYGTGATIAGGGAPGLTNQVSQAYGTIAGGLDNKAGENAVVGGGRGNSALGFRATVAGGYNNSAPGQSGTIGGGENNVVQGVWSTVGGGYGNSASGWQATIAGGASNVASDNRATIGGGSDNHAFNLDTTVCGGYANQALGPYSTVTGGSNNSGDGYGTAIGGGVGNSSIADIATIGGGLENRVSDNSGTIAGGWGNLAGNDNKEIADAQYATVGGGLHNEARATSATVSGGENNKALGNFSVVPGGSSNQAGANYSLAAGRRAIVNANHVGAFLFADSTDADFSSVQANEFAVRATGGIRLITAVDASGHPLAQLKLSPGSGSWEFQSDRDAKANLLPVDSHQILERLVAIPAVTWNYKTQDPSIRHIGPTAQDFARLGFGEDNRFISTVDAEGVALAAIKGLYDLIKERNLQLASQETKIEQLETQLTAQKARTDALEQRLTALEQTAGSNIKEPVLSTSWWPGAWMFLAPGILAGVWLSGRRSAFC